MTLQFKNMVELTEYLSTLEQRVNMLEAENRELRTTPLARPESITDRKAIAKYNSQDLPNTSLLSPNFLKRAFTVWGHWFTAQLVVSTIFLILYMCFLLMIFGTLAGSIQSSP